MGAKKVFFALTTVSSRILMKFQKGVAFMNVLKLCIKTSYELFHLNDLGISVKDVFSRDFTLI